MAEPLKRLNTFITAETFKKLKAYAVNSELTLGNATAYVLAYGLERLAGGGDKTPIEIITEILSPVQPELPKPPIQLLPASGSRPEHNPYVPLVADGCHDRESVTAQGTAGSQSSQEEESTIVRCQICGIELPLGALEIHEQNCRNAKQGYWDRKAFSV